MKQVYALVFGIGAFFAMNCGTGTEEGGGYSSSSSNNSNGNASSASATEAVTTVKVGGHSFDPPEVHVKTGATILFFYG